MTGAGKKLNLCRQARRGAWPLRLLRDFAVGRRGAVIIIFALALVPLLVMAGGAIDMARFYMAKSRIQYALDAALVAAGASDPAADRAAIFGDYFTANYPATSLGTHTLNPPDFTNPIASVFDASATLTLPTVFLPFAAINQLQTTVQASVVRQTSGVEVVLVLDSTFSMLDPAQVGAPTTKLDDLKAATAVLLDTLFQGQPTSPTVKVSIVPYVSTVNIGTGDPTLARSPPPLHQYPLGDADWKGCVEARPYPNDINDVYIPGDPVQGEWKRYFWEAEPYYLINNVPSDCRNPWWRPTSLPSLIVQPIGPTGRSGHPPFSSAPGTFTDIGLNPLPDIDPAIDGITIGPNKACPTALTPLTNQRAVLDTATNNLEGWNQGGTITSLGAVWGWRALSPGEPFTQGVAYGTPGVKKVMIIITDGENSILSGGNCGAINARYGSGYTGYGYTSEGNLGSANPITAQAETDTRLTEVCDAIKATNEITIFTITFGDEANAAVQNLMQSCATSPANHIHAPSASELIAAFQAIGAKLTNLRIAQ